MATWGGPALRFYTLKAEQVHDRMLCNVGTDEPWVTEEMSKLFGEKAVAAHYRRPLRIGEINRMAPTAAVKSRPDCG